MIKHFVSLVVGMVFASSVAAIEYRHVVFQSLDEDLPITAEVCKEVGTYARMVKDLIDQSHGDKVITDTLIEDSYEDLGNKDRWIARTMMTNDGMMDVLRNWPNAELFVWMRNTFPETAGRDHYYAYGKSLCDAKIGMTVNVKQVHYLPVASE